MIYWQKALPDYPKYENLLSVGIWCVIYKRLDGTPGREQAGAQQKRGYLEHIWPCDFNLIIV